MRTQRLVGWAVRFVLALVVAAATRPAVAQPGRGGMGMGPGMQDSLEPGITGRDIDRYAKFLGMNGDQAEAAKALLGGYQAEFDRGAREIREAMDAAREEFRESRDFSVWEDLRGTMEAWRSRRNELEKSFFKDLRELLTEEQAIDWPKLERMRRRDSTMRRGLISGESVDVIRLVGDLKLTPESRAALEPALDQYELELDKALIERNEAYEAGMGRGFALWRSGDMAEIQKLFDKARDAAVRVRDINRRAARQVEGLLPDDLRAEFGREFREKSFPRVYGDSYARRAIGMAQGFKDLTPDQAASIKEVQASYEREVGAVNDRTARAIEESELTQTATEMMTGGGSPALRESRLARRELDNRTVDRLKAALTEEQRSRLPARREREGGAGGRGAPGEPVPTDGDGPAGSRRSAQPHPVPGT